MLRNILVIFTAYSMNMRVQGTKIIKRRKSANECWRDPTQMALKAPVNATFGCTAKDTCLLLDDRMQLKQGFARLAVFFNHI